jgi:hypothetical protein
MNVPAPEIIKEPPLRSALIVPTLTMALPARPNLEVLRVALCPTWSIVRPLPRVRVLGTPES